MSGSTRVTVSQQQNKVIITSPPTTIVKTSPTYSAVPTQFYIRTAGDVAANLIFNSGYVLTWNAHVSLFDLEAQQGGSGGGSVLTGNTSVQNFLINNETSNFTANVAINLPTPNSNGLYMFSGQIGARDINTNNAKIWSIEGGIKTGNGFSMKYIGSPIINTITADNGTNNWVISLLTDSINTNMIIHGSGSTNTINWVSSIDITEIG